MSRITPTYSVVAVALVTLVVIATTGLLTGRVLSICVAHTAGAWLVTISIAISVHGRRAVTGAVVRPRDVGSMAVTNDFDGAADRVTGLPRDGGSGLTEPEKRRSEEEQDDR